MSVEGLSSDLAQTRLQQDVQTVVLAKSVGEIRSQGENLQELLDSAVLDAAQQNQSAQDTHRVDLLA